eukprot:2298292-Prymnesium_polylepis.2
MAIGSPPTPISAARAPETAPKLPCCTAVSGCVRGSNGCGERLRLDLLDVTAWDWTRRSAGRRGARLSINTAWSARGRSPLAAAWRVCGTA